MTYKKMLFPINRGEELQERIHGALLISKYFQAHLDILKAATSAHEFTKVGHLAPELDAMVLKRDKEDLITSEKFIREESKKLDITISNKLIKESPTVRIISDIGSRSKIIEQESRYCDLLLLASPPNGKVTELFETSITKSGKPVIMFPRELETFNTENILIGWNNSPQSARAVSLAIPLLQKAKTIHIVTSKEYIKESIHIRKLQEYLKSHNIETTIELVTTTLIPGEALLKKAKEGNFDMIVAGAFGRKGFRELMLGGTTEHILKKTTIPVFMSH